MALRGSEQDRILQHFAPIANGILPEDRKPEDELKVLIATEALSEGFNLQDSNILVNYDLPWTVLQLAHRKGRFLRPWDTPCELYIRDDASLDLDEVLEFIHNADSLTTSTFYKDLANIPNQSEITRLPAGILSARMSIGRKRLFVLFRQGSRQVRAGLFDASGKLVKVGDRREVALHAIRCM